MIGCQKSNKLIKLATYCNEIFIILFNEFVYICGECVSIQFNAMSKSNENL